MARESLAQLRPQRRTSTSPPTCRRSTPAAACGSTASRAACSRPCWANDALRTDFATCTARCALSGQQAGQFLRRLREAETRSGLPVFAQRAIGGSPAPQAPARASVLAAMPFTPLVCPPAGTRARQAFEKHVFDCLRDVVDFQQTSAYGA
jgi:hypothetical protein